MKTTNHSYGIAAILTAILLSLSLDVWGTDYVFYYTNRGTTYYLARNGTGGVQRVNTFDPTTCIWSCENSGGTASSLSNSTTYGWLYQTVSGTKYYLKHGGTVGLTTTKSTSSGRRSNNTTCWRTNGTYIYNAYQGNSTSITTYYISLQNSVASTTSSGNTCAIPQIVFRADVNVAVSTGLAGSEGGEVAISASNTAGTYGATASLSQYSTGSAQSKSFYIFAQPVSGYEFVGWTKSSSGTTAESITSPVNINTASTAGTISATTYYAIFRKLETKATVNVGFSSKSGTQDGTVSVSESKAAAGNLTTLTQTDTSGSQVDKKFYLWASLSAEAIANHYVFAGWTETADGEIFALGTAQPQEVTVKTGDNVVKNYYAVFKQLKHFQFEAIATPTFNGVESTTGGTASVTLDKTDVWATSLSQISDTATATFSATANPGYAFIGWTKTLGKTTPDIDENGNLMLSNPYKPTMTNTAGGKLTLHLYAIFSSTNDPTTVTVSPASATIDKGQTQQISLTFTPETCYKRYTFASSNTEVAAVNENGLVTGVKQGTTNITVTVYRYAGTVFQTHTVAVTVMDKLPAPVITITQDTTDPTKATATIVKGTGTPDEAVIRYTTDDSEPTATSPEYTAALTIDNLQTVKTIVTCDGWYSSDIVSKTFIMRKTATPVITITKSGDDNVVSFSCADDGEGGITYYYTLDGTDPTTSSTQWNGTAFTPTAAECTIKVIATHMGWQNSSVASEYYTRGSGTSGGVVYLNDLEDHNWTYYSGVDETVDGGNYNTAYKKKLYFPDPRNVKITYNGGTVSGCSYTASVSKTETETSFVYYKTLEQTFTAAGAATGNYAYRVIPNPFSRRPKSGSTYYGFNGWKIISGGEYISGHSNGDVLTTLEDDITFTNLPDPGVNGIAAEIVFEADWQTANVVTCAASAVNTNLTSSSLNSSYTYERNFIVVTSGSSTTNLTATGAKAVTITSVTPDGETDYRSSSCYLNPLVVTLSNAWKFEYINFNGTVGDGLTGDYWSMTGSKSTMIYANMKNLTIGRGVDNTTKGGIVAYQIVGYNTAAQSQANNTTGGNFNYHMRIESGNYHFLAVTQNWSFTYYPGINTCKATYGCDYDRAKGDNEKFKVRRRVYGGNGTGFTDSGNNDRETIIHVMKSGQLGCDLEVGNGDLNNGSNTQFNTTVYFGVIGWHCYDYNTSIPSYTGIRSFYMEGGIVGNLVGGCDKGGGTTNANESVKVRMTGGRVRGALYGAATQTWSKGNRRIIILGGTVEGWVAGGANGTATDAAADGEVDGTSFMYVGGNAKLNSNNSTTVINRAVGGNLFGAGCGMSAETTSGEVANGTNVVVADNAAIERGVYGGGSYGFTTATSNIYITGGHIEGKMGGVEGTSYDSSVQGGVYGGACQNQGGEVNIYMTGGVIERGLYGGSNKTGTISGNVKMVLAGGQIGTSSTTANVHGGGYGSTTVISQNVDITLGRSGQATNTAATIYGDVYGGSSLGKVNGTSAADTYHTNVTLNAGTINGSLYGGALGDGSTAANVYGPVAVKVYGGTVKPRSNVIGSGGVFGCNNVNGAPQRAVTVDIYGTDPAPAADQYALYAVYGGGNQSHYLYGNGYPKVTVHNCNNSIEYVYGGGNASNVVGTDVTIWGGDVIGNVFGGGNGSSEGWPEGQTNPGANVTTNGTKVKINGGTILAVYGGSNTLGTITGGTQIVVNAQKESGATEACPVRVDNIFGAGNQAPYTGNTDVQIINTGADGSVGNVFGGGNMADVTGNSNVKIGAIGDYTTKITGDVFGGGNKANTGGDTKVTVENCNTTILGDVYGGANLADVSNSNVTVYGGEIENVFGGGKGSETTSSDLTNATTYIYGGKFGGIFGAGNIQSNISGVAFLRVDEQTTSEHACCGFNGAKEIYGAGNQASITGSINFGIGCIPGRIAELYCGAKNADLGSASNVSNVELFITSGQFGKVFGGNNIGGTIYGTITINVQHSGCHKIEIEELYGGGNLADYSAPAGTLNYPEINLLTCGQSTVDWKNDDPTKHCLKVGTIYGGGKGESGKDKGKVTGNPHINVYAGEIGTIYGGGNAANVVGDTYVTIIDEHNKTGDNDNQDIYVTGNVYGGCNQAAITGNTHVQIGPKKDK